MRRDGWTARSETIDSVVLTLAITADEWRHYYRGAMRQIVARADDGRRIRFPAALLQRFVRHDGVHGRFRLAYDDRGRFVRIDSLG